jgi:hypothetical protein
VAVSVSTIAASSVYTEGAMKTIWHAASFRDEMVGWIATGRGTEGDITQFLPRVLMEYALVLALSAVSAGAGALFLGGLLLGYMNGYVGWVVAHSDPATHPWLVALAAWPPWSMCRVISFVLAGTAAALWGFRESSGREPHARRSPGCSSGRWRSYSSTSGSSGGSLPCGGISFVDCWERARGWKRAGAAEGGSAAPAPSATSRP